MTLEVEGVVGGGVHRDEALGGSRRLEPPHFALSSTEGLMGDLGPVVLVNSLFMVGAQADLLERSPVGAQLVGRHSGRSKAVLLQQLANELPGCGLVPPALDQDLQHLALIIDRSPQVYLPLVYAHHHLIKMPARAGPAPQLPQVPRNRRAELADPASDRLVRDIQPPLRQQLFNVPVAQREPEIEPHGMLDDGGRELVAGTRSAASRQIIVTNDGAPLLP